jgi:hypothetical protein
MKQLILLVGILISTSPIFVSLPKTGILEYNKKVGMAFIKK